MLPAGRMGAGVNLPPPQEGGVMSSRKAMYEIVSNSDVFSDSVMRKKNRVHEQIRKERKSKQRIRTGQDKGYSDPVGSMLGIVEKHFEHKPSNSENITTLIESLEFDINRLGEAVKTAPGNVDIENRIRALAGKLKGIAG